jgi:hypothetical protein
VRLAIIFALAMTSCAAAVAGVTVGCEVVGVLDEACLLIPVPNKASATGEDAGVHYVACSGKEMKAWGVELEARRNTGIVHITDSGTE